MVKLLFREFRQATLVAMACPKPRSEPDRKSLGRNKNHGLSSYPPLLNLKELEWYIKQAWKELPPEYYKKLIDSIPRHIRAVIAADGNATKY